MDAPDNHLDILNDGWAFLASERNLQSRVFRVLKMQIGNILDT